MSVGKEGLSAINLMEFSSRTSLARRNHKMCIVLLKKLWKTALKFKEQASNASAKSLIEGLYSVISLIFETTSMYEELVHKFPGSTSLRHDYAHFLDSVLNDPPRAEHEHRAAAVMEAGSSRTEEEKFDPINTVAISTTSGTLSYRSIQRLYVLSWANRVMSEPERYLRVLHWTVLGLVTVLLLVAVSGFIVLEIYLVSTGMEQRLGFLEQAKGLRVDIFRSCYELRSIYLAACGLEANATSKAALNSAIGNLTQISDSFRKMHNYNYITFPHISSSDFFVRESLAELKVLPGSTEQTEVNTSFLTLGVEWSDSSIDATRIGPADLCNHDFRINAGMSDGKQAVVFIFSNLDVIFAGLRMFLDIIMSEIRYIQTLTNNVTYTLLCVETVMLLGISIVVLRRIRTTFPHCQVGLAGGHLTHGIDTATVQKFIRYYVRIQRRLEQLEYDHSDLFQMQAHDSQTESKDEDGEEEEEPCEDDGNLEPDEGGDAEMANVPREAARPLALPAHLHPLDYAPSSLHSPPGTDCFNTSLASQSPSPIRSSIRTRKPSVKSSLACGSEQFRAGFGPGFGLGNFSQVLEPAGQQGTSQVLPLTSANLSKHISRLQAPSRLTLAGASSGFAAEAANASGAGRTRICSPRKAQPSVHRHSRLSASPHMAPAEKASELHVPASRAGCDDENQPPLRDADPAQKRTPKDELAGPSLTMSDRSSGRPSAENGHGSKPSILRLRLPRMEGDAWDFEPPSCDRAFVSARTRASALNSGGGADRESVLEEGSSDARSSHSSQIIMDRRPQRTEFTPRAQSFERQGEDLLPSERRPVDRCSEPSPGARALETEANPRAQAENRATSVRPYNPESMDFLRINGCSRRTQDAEVSRHSRNNLQVPAPAILVGVKAGDEPPAGALYQPPPQPKRRSLHDSPPVTSSARGSHSGEGPISLPRVANGSAERPRPPPKPLNGEQRSSRALGGGSVKLDPSQALDKVRKCFILDFSKYEDDTILPSGNSRQYGVVFPALAVSVYPAHRAGSVRLRLGRTFNACPRPHQRRDSSAPVPVRSGLRSRIHVQRSGTGAQRRPVPHDPIGYPGQPSPSEIKLLPGDAVVQAGRRGGAHGRRLHHVVQHDGLPGWNVREWVPVEVERVGLLAPRRITGGLVGLHSRNRASSWLHRIFIAFSKPLHTQICIRTKSTRVRASTLTHVYPLPKQPPSPRENPISPQSASHGLNNLLLTFYNSLDLVESRFGGADPPLGGIDDSSNFSWVFTSPARTRFLHSDAAVGRVLWVSKTPPMSVSR
mmetsp:Transcript_60945/g.163498  ORF Transcript_60945/g.163498 Transcript_60945/m.163498 type:complete len:1287 (+) Transcript_60945:1924-5784(+)